MIEYRVRPVTRWAVTRYEQSENGGSCGHICESSSKQAAETLAEAMAIREDGTYEIANTEDLKDIPLLLRRIADQVESGELRADVGVLTLRATGQRRPTVFGFGAKVNGVSECGRAAEEILFLQGVPRATKEQARKAVEALSKIA